VVQRFSYQPIAERKCEGDPTGRMWLSGFLVVPASDLHTGAPTPGDVSWHRQSWPTLGSARLTVALRHGGICPFLSGQPEQRAFELQDLLSSLYANRSCILAPVFRYGIVIGLALEGDRRGGEALLGGYSLSLARRIWARLALPERTFVAWGLWQQAVRD
jgi:hypothetical protein